MKGGEDNIEEEEEEHKFPSTEFFFDEMRPSSQGLPHLCSSGC